jgi:hypothetical protein
VQRKALLVPLVDPEIAIDPKFVLCVGFFPLLGISLAQGKLLHEKYN